MAFLLQEDLYFSPFQAELDRITFSFPFKELGGDSVAWERRMTEYAHLHCKATI